MKILRNSVNLMGDFGRGMVKAKAELWQEAKKVRNFAIGVAAMPLAFTLQWACWKGAEAAGFIKNANVVLDAFQGTRRMSCRSRMTTAALTALMSPLTCVNAPYTEELMCRDVIQDKFGKAFLGALRTRFPQLGLLKSPFFDKVLRIGLSSIAFSGMHLANYPIIRAFSSRQAAWEGMKFQLVNTFGMGVSAGILKEVTGSLWPCVGYHAAWNTLATGSNIAASFLPVGSQGVGMGDAGGIPIVAN